MRKLAIVWTVVLLAFLAIVSLARAADVTFEFTPNTTGATPTKYQLYQTQTQGQYTYGLGSEVASVPHPESLISITDVPEGVYFWVLTAANADGESGPSNEVTADLSQPTPPTIPGSPSVIIKIIVN